MRIIKVGRGARTSKRAEQRPRGERKERQNTLKRLQFSCVTELQLLSEFVAFDHRNHSTMARTHTHTHKCVRSECAGRWVLRVCVCVCAPSPFALHFETNE